MRSYILFAVLLAVLLWVIYRWAQRDTRRRARAQRSLSLSPGTFDANARAALRDLRELDRPTPGDRRERANILRYNLSNGRPCEAAAREIASDYAEALEETSRYDNAEAEFLIHTADEFYVDLQTMGITDIPLGALAETARTERHSEIRERVAQSPASRIETISDLLSPVYPADRQNVHDTKINKDLAYMLGKLRRDTDSGLSADPTAEILRHTLQTDCDQARVGAALSELNSENSFMSALGASEREILAYVWARCFDSRNSANRGRMCDAVVQALSDCVENNAVVCSNGRCARLLNAFVTLDFDAEISAGALTFTAYRNQVFSETEEIVRRVVAEYSESPDKALRQAALAYTDPDAIASAIASDRASDSAEKIRERIRGEVSQNLKKYEAIFSETEMSAMRDECDFISEM